LDGWIQTTKTKVKSLLNEHHTMNAY